VPRWLEHLLDDAARARLAARIDPPIAAAFNIVRNAGFVALAQFIAAQADNPAFTLVYLALALMLVVQIASRFMLQPQIRFLPDPPTDRKRLLEGLANMALCAVACAVALAAIDLLVEGMISFQIGTN